MFSIFLHKSLAYLLKLFLILSRFLYMSLFFFWLCREARGILVPRPRIGPTPWAVQAWSPNHWTTREFPLFLDKIGYLSCSSPHPQLYWDIIDILCKFKVYNVVIWYTCVLQDIYHKKVNTSFTSYNYHFLLWWWWEHLRSTLLASFKYTTQYC